VKYFDQSLQLGAVTSGNLYNISDVTRGDEVTQRIGNEIFLKKIEFRISASLNSNVTKASIRYLILIDKMGYNAPVVTDILDAGLVGTSYSDIAPYYWDYKRRFVIRRDVVLSLTKGGVNEYLARRFSIPLNLRANYIGSATTFKNQVYLLIIGSETNVLNISSFQYHSRLHFTDE